MQRRSTKPCPWRVRSAQHVLISIGVDSVPLSDPSLRTRFATPRFAVRRLGTAGGPKSQGKEQSSTWLGRVTAAGNGVSPPAPSFEVIATTGAAAFAGMGVVSAFHFGVTSGSDLTMILASMGASAALIFAAPSVPFSQPRNVIGGHLISASIGVLAYSIFPASMIGLAIPTATAGAIMLMQATKTLHPPAGGTVLIALMGSANVHALGFMLLCPVGVTSGLLVAAGVALHNLSAAEARKYPTYWW